MRRFMPIAASGFAILVTVGLCAVAIRQAFAACEGCQTTCGDENKVQILPANEEVNADSFGVFEAEFCFDWEYDVKPPDYIVFEFNDDPASTNIDEDNTFYSPSLITNTACCIGFQDVTINGELDDNCVDGTLQSQGWAAVPFRVDTHTLVVRETCR